MTNAHCPCCQSGRSVRGTLRSSGIVHFRLDFDFAKFLTFHTADIKVRAMMCSGCGLISMIGDVEKLRLLESGHEAEKELAS